MIVLVTDEIDEDVELVDIEAGPGLRWMSPARIMRQNSQET